MARVRICMLIAAACCLGLGSKPAASGAKIMLEMSMILNTPSQHIVFSAVTEPLVERGHEVILLAPRNKITKGLTDGAVTGKIFFENPRTEKEQQEILQLATSIMLGFSQGSMLNIFGTFRESMSLFTEGCLRLWEDKKTLQRLKDERFDLIITMPVVGCGSLLAEYLGIPFVAMTPIRRAPTFSEDTMGIPVPSSYVPFNILTTFTDEMTFLQRTANLLIRHIVDPTMSAIITGSLRNVQLEFNIRPDLSVTQLMGRAQLWLCQTHFALEFAQPTAPNYVIIGGITARPAKSLSREMEDFVQGSGEHGVVVFTLGSMIGSLMDDDLTEKLAKVFSELPQRVLWRYKGPKPRNLGNNTHIADWLPQNDLLGHPKTRLLIYHGGANGIYEAVGHGVPLLLMPLAFDQMSNAVRVKAKGLGFTVDKNTLTEDSFRAALREILHDPKYAKNSKRASGIMKDELVPTREKVAYYIEHILKFGGDHLRSRALELNFIQRESIDVVAFLLVVFVIFIVAARWCVCKCCCWWCRRQRTHVTKPKSD